MKSPRIGQEVILESLLHEGKFRGQIIAADPFGTCVVQLDCQVDPVAGVLFYQERPEEIRSSLWQICYPA